MKNLNERVEKIIESRFCFNTSLSLFNIDSSKEFEDFKMFFSKPLEKGVIRYLVMFLEGGLKIVVDNSDASEGVHLCKNENELQEVVNFINNSSNSV